MFSTDNKKTYVRRQQCPSGQDDEYISTAHNAIEWRSTDRKKCSQSLKGGEENENHLPSQRKLMHERSEMFQTRRKQVTNYVWSRKLHISHDHRSQST